MANSSTSSKTLSQLVFVFGITTAFLLWSCQAMPRRDQNEDDLEKALKHYHSMRKHACSKPQPRTIRVQDVHDEPDKKFSPSYVLLHRCDSQAGCCSNASQVCSPLETEPVTLYFIVRQMSPDQENVISPKHKRRHYWKDVADHREFVNHISCYCKDI